MRTAMRFNLMTLLEQVPQVLFRHAALCADPFCGNEKNRPHAILFKERYSEIIVGYMSIIESYVMSGVSAVKLAKHEQVFLKLGAAHLVKIVRALALKFMVREMKWNFGF